MNPSLRISLSQANSLTVRILLSSINCPPEAMVFTLNDKFLSKVIVLTLLYSWWLKLTYYGS